MEHEGLSFACAMGQHGSKCHRADCTCKCHEGGGGVREPRPPDGLPVEAGRKPIPTQDLEEVCT